MLELIATATTIHPNLFGALWIAAALFSTGWFLIHRGKTEARPIQESWLDQKSTTNIWLLAFGPLLVISTTSALTIGTSISRIEVAEILIGGALLSLGLRWIRISQSRLITAAVAGALASVVISLIDLEVYNYGRAGRSFHPINFAIAAGCLSIILSHALMQNDGRRRLVILVGFVASIAALVLSESRGPMLSLIGALSVTAIVRLLSSSNTISTERHRWIWGAVVVVVALFTAIGLRTINDVIEHGAQASVQIRLEILEATLRQIRETPLFGVGVDQAGNFFAAISRPEQSINHAHSTLLNATLELGVLGGFAWCWAFLVIGWVFFKARNVRSDLDSSPRKIFSDSPQDSSLSASFVWQVGLSLVLFFFLCSLTQDLLSHSFTRKLIAFYLVLFLAMLSKSMSNRSG